MAKYEVVPLCVCISLLLVSVLSCVSISLSVWLTLQINLQQATIEEQAAEISVLKEYVNGAYQTSNFPRNPSDSGSDIRREVISKEGDAASNGLEMVLQQLATQRGIVGPPGPPGAAGAAGSSGRDGRDAISFAATQQFINRTVVDLTGIEMDKVRLATKEIPIVAGAVYVRWGRTTCPGKSSLIYKGIAAGTPLTSPGGSTKYSCLPEDPESSGENLSHVDTKLTAAEYRDASRQIDESAPCAVCQAENRSAKLMIPAKLRCPDSSWTLEYVGYLMTNHITFRRTEHVCVDMHKETRPGQPGANNGAYFYPMYVKCDGEGNLFHCPPYNDLHALNCVVCTK